MADDEGWVGTDEDGSALGRGINADGSLAKKRGRRRTVETVRIMNPNVNPAVAQRDADYGDDIGVARIFSDVDDTGMHFEWPLYSNVPLRMRDVFRILLSDIEEIRLDSAICTSVPQEFTGTGCFIVDTRALPNATTSALLSHLAHDSLGRWGRPSCSSHTVNAQGAKVPAGDANGVVKVQMDKFVHPGTEPQGRYFKTIYTAVTIRGDAIPFALIAYQWEGTPHPIAVHEDPNSKRIRWMMDDEDELGPGPSSMEPVIVDETQPAEEGCPVFSHEIVDYDEACNILLGGREIPMDRVCSRVPGTVRGTPVTFFVHLDKCGGERALLNAGGPNWNKPSGNVRFFRYRPDDGEDGGWIRVDTSGRVPEGIDPPEVQVVSRRYESSSNAGLMRKVFVTREINPVVEPALPPFAIVCIYWRSQAKQVQDSRRPPVKRTRDEQLEDMLLSMDATADWSLNEMPLGPADQLKRMALAKELENHNRLASVLDRAERFMTRFEESLLNRMQRPPAGAETSQ